VSHWSGSGWSADCFVENGVTHLIAGTQRQSITRAQLDAAVAAGMTVDAYVYLYWGSSITAQVQYALETIQGYPVTRLWLDAENSAAGYTPSQILQKIQEGLDACGSTPCGIYTAKWWWDPATNYSTAFADVPLWYARYDLNPDFNDWYNGYSDFGGWVDPTGKQYQGSNYFCGVNVDKNVMHVGAAPTAPFQGETGRVTTRQADASTWHGVAFEHGYTAPVVVMQPLSFNGGDPTTIRIRNVTSTGFEWQMDEWDYKDGAHTTETVAYLVMESGVFQLEGGTLVEAGTVSADHNFVTVALDQGFAETPVILTQAQTYADPAAVVTRQRNAGPGGFEVRLQEQEANDPAHALETVGYVAVAPGLGMTAGVAFEAALTPDAVTHAWYGLTFQDGYGDPVLLAGLQTRDGGDTAGLRYRNLQTTSVEMFVEEETSRDTEVAHTTEVVGYLVFDHPGSLTEDGGGNNPPPAPTGLSPDAGVPERQRGDDEQRPHRRGVAVRVRHRARLGRWGLGHLLHLHEHRELVHLLAPVRRPGVPLPHAGGSGGGRGGPELHPARGHGVRVPDRVQLGRHLEDLLHLHHVGKLQDVLPRGSRDRLPLPRARPQRLRLGPLLRLGLVPRERLRDSLAE
jgi:hypothetical protein